MYMQDIIKTEFPIYTNLKSLNQINDEEEKNNFQVIGISRTKYTKQNITK